MSPTRTTWSRSDSGHVDPRSQLPVGVAQRVAEALADDPRLAALLVAQSGDLPIRRPRLFQELHQRRRPRLRPRASIQSYRCQ